MNDRMDLKRILKLMEMDYEELILSDREAFSISAL